MRNVFFAREKSLDGGMVLHVFHDLDQRNAWIRETDGLSLASPGGRGHVSDHQIEHHTGRIVEHIGEALRYHG